MLPTLPKCQYVRRTKNFVDNYLLVCANIKTVNFIECDDVLRRQNVSLNGFSFQPKCQLTTSGPVCPRPDSVASHVAPRSASLVQDQPQRHGSGFRRMLPEQPLVQRLGELIGVDGFGSRHSEGKSFLESPGGSHRWSSGRLMIERYWVLFLLPPTYRLGSSNSGEGSKGALVEFSCCYFRAFSVS